MRSLLLIMLLTYIANAMDMYPKRECQAFNNLKHTKNSGGLVLKLDHHYKMYSHHKRQYLVEVKDGKPSQRWVDDDCLTYRPLHNTTAKSIVKNHHVTHMQNLLALSWHNTFCEFNRNKLECRHISEYNTKHFVLHGLWPQPRSNVYCGVSHKVIKIDKSRRWKDISQLTLDDKTRTELINIMPGYVSGLQRHEFAKHGSCYGTSANVYFKDAISLVKQVNNSLLGELFTDSAGEYLSLKEIKAVTDEAFGKGTGARVTIKCRRGLITELWLHLGTGSDDLSTLLKLGEPAHNRSCKGGRVDEVQYKN